MLHDYLELCKPKVILLMLLTAIVGMALAPQTQFMLGKMLGALFGIACCAASAAVINHLVDRRIDAIMVRTHMRPLVMAKILVYQAVCFASVLGLLGFGCLIVFVNKLTAILTLITLIGYAVIYTGYLKRATPQNIVIGGLAGAAPPLLGWTTVTNHIDPQALLLVLIIFTWTPPHFWALAIHRLDDYKNAKIPMLPVTHGVHFTKLYLLLYTILLTLVSTLPAIIGLSGKIYLCGSLILNGRFLLLAINFYLNSGVCMSKTIFYFSIKYLAGLFSLLLLDHYA